MSRAYERRTGRSGRLFERAKRVFAGGVNHNARYYEPYPIFVKRAKGAHIWDQDGNRYTDYWMGHLALILGHSPPVVVKALEKQVGKGTHFGASSELAVELGEEIQVSVPCAELIRFCNTGAEATMYLVRLARGYSGKRTIIKMEGGWHGFNTGLNKGVHEPFERPESAGILPEEQTHVVSVRFNDFDAARRAVKQAEGDVAAIFLEPVLGAGGWVPAEMEYLKGLRELANETGILLAFDEIITGFRLALGGAQEWYGVKPDLATLGKIAGGGLPLGLVCGQREILELADPAKRGRFVSIGGGTFSENPLTMTAGLETVRHLRFHAGEIYPRLDRMGRTLRTGVDEALAERGLDAHTTGAGSIFFTHFGIEPRNAKESAKADQALRKKYALHLISQGIFVNPGSAGGVSTAHTDSDVGKLIEMSRSMQKSVQKAVAK